MSDHIPLELQAEIIKRVPLKSLLQFRSVSKEWKSVIDSPDFGDDYCLRQSQPRRLLIRYTDITSILNDYKYVWVADDDDTFHQHQIPSTTLPKSVNNGMVSKIVGCAHGLFCFYGYDLDHKSYMAVVWNPWIRKCVDVPVPNVLFGWYETVLGFGVSPLTKDPMIVKINSYVDSRMYSSVCTPWRVEVFTLSSGTWKTPSGSINNLPCRDSIRFCWGQVALDGVIYWLAFEWIKVDGKYRDHNLIMSFDLSSEGFQEVCLPDNLARLSHHDLSITKRMESVVVLERDATRTSCGVWMMGKGVTKSFTKLFTVMPWVVSPYFMICGFRKNAEPIVDHGSNALFAYDSYSEPKNLVIVGKSSSFSMEPYMETLLLIDQ
uniref:putative F-box protein At1g47790 n=1 Tax=Erigeron canadensis TaxID=72917 RepID=UPI001CB91471|nr:putative F-box protein At1g47790 [Erigeron canadensis]